MLKTRCPACDSDLDCPDRLTGKKVRCPKCAEPFTALAATKLLPPQKINLPASRPDPFDDDDLDDEPGVPQEPWYYGYVEKYTKVLHWLGIALYGGATLAITIGLILMAVVITAAAQNPLWAVPLILPWLVSIVVCVLGLLLYMVGIAVLHMFVDTCRNIRATRYGI